MPIKKEKLYDQVTVAPISTAKTTAAAKTEEVKKAETAAKTVLTAPAAAAAAPAAALAAPAAASVQTAAAAAPSPSTAGEQSKTAAQSVQPAAAQAAAAADSGSRDSEALLALQRELDYYYQQAAQTAAAKKAAVTEAAILELRQAEQEARAALGDERARIAADEARALDNAALYAELRGDKGGIGQAQYSYIMGAAEGSKAKIGAEQRKLANDTAMEIESLRAKGEYEKAEALLELAQDRLSQLSSLYKLSQDYALDKQKLDNELLKQQQDYELKKAGLVNASSGTQSVSQLFEDMLASANPYTYLSTNAKNYGIYSNSPTILSEIMNEYRLWLKTK